MCYWALGVEDIGVQYDMEFKDADLRWLVGAGGNAFQAFATKVLDIIAPDPWEQLKVVSETDVEKVCEMAKECLKRRAEMFPANKWGRYLRHFGDGLEGVEGKHTRDKGANFEARRCGGCRYWMFDYANLCPVCGTRPVAL